jgi:hypothetical protein
MSWDPYKYSNTALVSVVDAGFNDGRQTLNSDGTYEMAVPGYNTALPPPFPLFASSAPTPPFYQASLPRATFDLIDDSDAALRQVMQASQFDNGGMSYTAQATLPVFDMQTNPVEYLNSRVPMPSISSPARVVGQQQLVQQQPVMASAATALPPTSPVPLSGVVQPQEDNLCCVLDIPSKELRQVREDLGAEVADFARWGVGAGAGIQADLTVAPEDGTGYNYGPVAVSTPLVNAELYDQGFISLSAVPVVQAGKYKDPLTGVEYVAYESALPPPDADYEETLNNSARNVKLARLQGGGCGFSDNTPRPTRTELVEDDFHMQYDRSINTYGTYDASRYVEYFERSNRFKRDDEHPDPDGECNTDQLPANTMGNQPGQVKIRPLPYLPPTNRGKWAETTFRDGIDPRVAVGNAETMVARTYTKFPCARMENTRMDGGGMQVTANTTAHMDTQMGLGRRDLMPTQRSVSEQYMPAMGPADYVRLGSNVGSEQYEPSTKYTGTYLVDNNLGAITTAHQAASTERDQVLEAPHALTGTYVVDQNVLGTVQVQDAYAPKNNNQIVQAQNSKSGVLRDDAYGAYGGAQHQATQVNPVVYEAQDLTKREELLDVYSGADTTYGHNTGAQTVAARTRFSTKKGPLVDFMMPSGALNGTDDLFSGAQSVGASTKLNSKKEAQYGSQYGFNPTTVSKTARWLGYYNQTAEHMNMRPYGNMEHLVGPASYGFFMEQRECEA